MKKSLIFLAAAIATVLLSLPGTASAQVAFGGTFRGPHGSFSVGVGAPFSVGAVVPYPYVRRVYLRPDYGYGFYYNSDWIPCEPYGSSWIIAQRPVFYQRPIVRDYRYVRPFRSYGREFARRDRGDRRFGSDRDNRNFGRDRDHRRW